MRLHNFGKKILEFAKKDKVVTTAEIAKHFDISWNTAERYLLELALDGKLGRLKKRGVNLWILR